MNRLRNVEIANMRLAYSTANVNARRTARIYRDRFLYCYVSVPWRFTNLHCRLRGSRTFGANRVNAGRPSDKDVLRHIRSHPCTSIRLFATDQTTVWSVLRDIYFHPHYFQGLQPEDCKILKILSFGKLFLDQEVNETNFPNKYYSKMKRTSRMMGCSIFMPITNDT